MKILELFGGIGACTSAFKRLKIPYEVVDYVDIDKYATASYNAINGTNFEPQDIRDWNKDIEVDLIMHGSPCQDFSVAGNNAGGDKGSGTRSSLMYETLRIVEKLKPKYVIWENVKNLLSKKHKHNFDSYIVELNRLGYTSFYKVLNAKDYGIPQNRERVFTISILNGGEFEFPQKQPLKLRLKDLLEDNVDKKYYLDKKTSDLYQIKNIELPCIVRSVGRNPNNPSDRTPGVPTVQRLEVNTKGVSNTLTSIQKDNYVLESGNQSLKIKSATKLGYMIARNGDSVNLAFPKSNTQRGRVGKDVSQTITTSETMGVIDSLRIRKLTPRECWRLMGFNDEDFEKASKVNSNTQLYKQAGNSIVVNVLVSIFENLFKGDVLNVYYRKNT